LQVLLYIAYKLCLCPGPQSWTRHLRQPLYGLGRAPLKSSWAAAPRRRAPLASHGICKHKTFTSPGHINKSRHSIRKPLFSEPTYFAENRLIRYFVIALKSDHPKLAEDEANQGISYKEENRAAINIIHSFGSHRSAVIPWLQQTGIKDYLEGLDKEQIQASFSLPKDTDSKPELFLILKTRVHAHLATIASPESFPHCNYRKGSRIRAKEKARDNEDQPPVLETVPNILLSGRIWQRPLYNRIPADSVQLTDKQANTWAEVIKIQLLIFYTSVSLEKASYKNILDFIKAYYKRFLRPETETLISEILG
ncbi:hypothetical protein LSUE1_G008814, partial [Lachnellula suecica]